MLETGGKMNRKAIPGLIIATCTLSAIVGIPRIRATAVPVKAAQVNLQSQPVRDKLLLARLAELTINGNNRVSVNKWVLKDFELQSPRVLREAKIATDVNLPTYEFVIDDKEKENATFVHVPAGGPKNIVILGTEDDSTIQFHLTSVDDGILRASCRRTKINSKPIENPFSPQEAQEHFRNILTYFEKHIPQRSPN
jgi:hypothetical protein